MGKVFLDLDVGDRAAWEAQQQAHQRCRECFNALRSQVSAQRIAGGPTQRPPTRARRCVTQQTLPTRTLYPSFLSRSMDGQRIWKSWTLRRGTSF